MKTLWKKGRFSWLIIVLVILLCIGMSNAYYTDVEAMETPVRVGSVYVETIETVSGLEKSDIGVQVTGRTESYIRMQIGVPDFVYEYKEPGQETAKTGSIQVTTYGDSILTAEEWKNTEKIPAKIIRAGTEDTETASWYLLDDGFWYLSTTLNTGDQAGFVKKLTYPGLWDADKTQVIDPLPLGLTMDMLTIPIHSEAVQVPNLDTKDVEEIENEEKGACLRAQRAFELVESSGK